MPPSTFSTKRLTSVMSGEHRNSFNSGGAREDMADTWIRRHTVDEASCITATGLGTGLSLGWVRNSGFHSRSIATNRSCIRGENERRKWEIGTP